MHLKPVTPEMIDEKFRLGNQWATNRFLTMLLIAKYENGNQVRITNQKFQHFKMDALIERELSTPEMLEKLKTVFGIQSTFYERANQLLKQTLLNNE